MMCMDSPPAGWSAWTSWAAGHQHAEGSLQPGVVGLVINDSESRGTDHCLHMQARVVVLTGTVAPFEVVVQYTPFKVDIGQDGHLLVVGEHVPVPGSPEAMVGPAAQPPHGQDIAIGLVGKPVGIGTLLKSLAGDIVLPLRGPIEASLAAEGPPWRHCATLSWTTPVPFLLQSVGFTTPPCRIPGAGPQVSHDVHELYPVLVAGSTQAPVMETFTEGPLLVCAQAVMEAVVGQSHVG